MHVSLPYHTGVFGFDLRARSGIKVVGDAFPRALENPHKNLRDALDKPVGSLPLRKMLPSSGAISVLISDLTRGGSTGKLLGSLLGFLEEQGVESDRVSIVVALGAHRVHSRVELERHLGAEIIKRWKVLEHDARDGGSLTEVGATPAGTRCLFNTRVVESALVIALGTVSFHYFAGYGGGRKLILPGVAGEKTILSNHRLSLRKDAGEGLSDGCRPGNLEGNPVHRDMLAGARLLEARLFAVNSIADDRGNILFLNAGELDASHKAACDFLSAHFRVPVDRRYRAAVVSAGGHPKDINLLQSHKALRHSSYALDEGGVMLAAAACAEGVGSDSYLGAFDNGSHGAPDLVRRAYTLNSQTAMSTYELTKSFSIYLKSMMPDELIGRFGFCPWKEDYADYLLEGIADDDVIIVPNASQFLLWPK